MTHKTDLYFESHITIEPVFDNRLAEFKRIGGIFGFKVAELLMQKRIKDSPEKSSKDSFCTSRGKDFDQLEINTLNLVDLLKENGFKVFRYKIENTLVDVRL